MGQVVEDSENTVIGKAWQSSRFVPQESRNGKTLTLFAHIYAVLPFRWLQQVWSNLLWK